MTLKNCYKIIFFALLTTIIINCKKDEEIIVPNNTAPPDPTISTVTKENYINKVYISVLGRKALQAEYDEAITILNKNNLSKENRSEFLDIVLNKSEYARHAYDIAKADLLNNIDSTELYEQIYLFTFLLADSNYIDVWPQLEYEKNRLELLAEASDELGKGDIDIIELHRRCVNNYVYDQINMGSENFVVSTFQHFLNRYPTTSELEDGIKMVDGMYAYLFLKEGQNKEEYLDIFFSSENYFEGQVFDLFLRYLFREPSSEEMASLAIIYKNNMNYKELQKEIMAMDEYVGID